MSEMKLKILEECSLLVLCKSELFFQAKDGLSITSWYPVGKEAATVCSLYFEIPLSYDGGPDINNEQVIERAFKEDERKKK